MPTLVLGTVGRVFGRPVGGLVGTVVGGFVDRSVLGSRSGGNGRPANLTVQSAAYGEAILVVTGRMRVAGNLIWSAGIAENTGGGASATARRHRQAIFTRHHSPLVWVPAQLRTSGAYGPMDG